MTHANRRYVLIALSSMASMASAGVFTSDRTVKGSGRPTTERRPISGIDRVSIAGPFDVEIRQGSIEALEMTGDDNLMSLIESRVEGTPGRAALRIGPKEGTQLDPSQPIRVRIDLVHVSGLGLAGDASLKGKDLRAPRLGVSIGGSGSVDLPGLQTERLTVDIGGSGNARADGKAGMLAVNIGGSGKCAMARLAVDDVKITIAGSGDAEVNAARQLSVSIAGSGRVRYSGAAVPSVSIVGSGSVERAG